MPQPPWCLLAGSPLSQFCCPESLDEHQAAHISRSECKLSYLTQPKSVDIVEGLGLSDVIDNDDGVSPLVVGTSNGPESLLAGSVPDLELNHLSSDGK